MAGYGAGLKGGDLLSRKGKTGFFGLSGGIGDTGVSYALMVRNKKITTTSVTASQQDALCSYMKASSIQWTTAWPDNGTAND